MDPMDRRWIFMKDRRASEYLMGINSFLQYTKDSVDTTGCMLCPCIRCVNRLRQPVSTVRAHLIMRGFTTTYTRWYYHGETIEEVQTVEPTSYNDTESDEMIAALHDEAGPSYFNVGPLNEEQTTEVPPNVNQRYDTLYEEVDKELYPGCKKFSTLTFIVKLMHIKVLNKWSDKSFNMLLKLIEQALPEGNRCPKTYYDTKKLLVELGLGYQNIDVCKFDCALFYGAHEGDEKCPICGHARYKHNKVPYKRLRYFPLTPRLKRLYSSRHTAGDMRWHKEKRQEEEGVLRHPADGIAWKHFDEQFPTFAYDCRNVRMGLASDGFNPFGNMSTAYSMWPVILIPYNLPPWRCMKQNNYLMALMIPGRKSPGKDFDVFMRPLVDELKRLWTDGVEAYDTYSKSWFTLRAAVIWTISDFPAYAYLSGYSTKGYKACPECLDDTHSRRLRSRLCYMGARKWLERGHRWRKSKEFDGSTEYGSQPQQYSGDDILKMLEGLPIVTSGKAPGNASRKRKRSVSDSNWLKCSILFELEYWPKLKLRHNLDVMHIEKNVCDNIVGTLLDIEGKTKDTEKARMDLKDIGIRSELWLEKTTSGVLKKPHASYTLTVQERKGFLEFLKSVKMPDGYASNIRRCVTDDGRLTGLKTHDCHVLLQKLLPAGILSYLNNEVRSTIIELSNFFSKICARTLYVSELEELKKGIVLILCKLEKIFPPAFFSIMVHLCLHLPEQAILGGPVSMRWMFGVERCLGTYKKFVRNNAHPEGSIAEAYVVDEVLTYCSQYIQEIETRFTRPERNVDVQYSVNEDGLGIFNQRVRCFGAIETRSLDALRDKAQWYVLNNCDIGVMQKYFDEHMMILKRDHSQRLQELQERTFPSWFKEKMQQLHHLGSNEATDSLFSLAEGPYNRYKSCSSCIVNGVRFHSKERDDKLRTQNSGISVPSMHDGASIDFFGVLLEVIELSYIMDKKVVLFRCKWFNTNSRLKNIQNDYTLTSIKVSGEWYSQEPFILAEQAQQVFYLPDMKRGDNWRVVQKVNHRHIWDVPEHDEEENVELLTNEVLQQSESSNNPFAPEEVDIEATSLVRRDIAPTIIEDMGELFVDLNSYVQEDISDSDEDEEEVDDAISTSSSDLNSSDDNNSDDDDDDE